MSINPFWAQREETAPATFTNANGAIIIRAGGRRLDIEKALSVRDAVFVQEQNVPVELEHDNLDAEALHLLAIDTATNKAVGTARILEKGLGVAKIGRVAVLKEYRGRGIGQAIMNAAFKVTRELNFRTLVLDAQVPVIPFYEALGFVAEGPEFEDAGIPHRHMTRPV